MASQQNTQMPMQTNVQQPVAQTTGVQQPGMGQQMQPPKKSKWWLWVLIAVVVIGAGIAAYFLFLK